MGADEWIIIIAGIVLILVLLYFITGCAKSQQITDLDVLWSDGKCIFHAKGMSIEQAEEIKNDWNFSECDVEVNDLEDQTIKE